MPFAAMARMRSACVGLGMVRVAAPTRAAVLRALRVRVDRARRFDHGSAARLCRFVAVQSRAAHLDLCGIPMRARLDLQLLNLFVRDHVQSPCSIQQQVYAPA